MTIRIIDGIAYEPYWIEGAFSVRTFERNGVMERSVRQLRGLREMDGIGRRLNPSLYEEPDAETLARREAEAAIERAKKREQNARAAKTACRRIIIAEGFNELLTLTYRENQADRALCKKHFKEWVRRIKRALPNFRYCASFERQERGAMHVHLATHKLPEHVEHKGVRIKAYELGTRVWRSVVGADNGMCFVGGSTKFGSKRRRNMSLAKMAGYVSKYLMKDWEDVPKGENRYSHSMGDPMAKAKALRPHYAELFGTTLAEVIAVCFELGEGDTLHSWRANELRGSLWMVKEQRAAWVSPARAAA